MSKGPHGATAADRAYPTRNRTHHGPSRLYARYILMLLMPQYIFSARFEISRGDRRTPALVHEKATFLSHSAPIAFWVFYYSLFKTKEIGDIRMCTRARKIAFGVKCARIYGELVRRLPPSRDHQCGVVIATSLSSVHY